MATAIINAPDARALLPPLLACLPTAFVSPHPPPALLPLLSPILRQRLTLLSGNTSSGNGGWLSLLSWDTSRAKKLGKHLEGVQFEAHPVSGELELEDVADISYRRLDEETLHSRLQVSEFGLLPIFVWIENDSQNGGTGTGWKLAELRVLEDGSEDSDLWHSSLDAAEAAFSKPAPTASSATATAVPAVAQTSSQPPAPTAQHATAKDEEDDDDDDDDYWAQYDSTPGRTPARTPAKHSPAPTSRPFASSNLSTSNVVGASKEEVEYFARYASEVQPALDSHDPDEENEIAGESTLRGEEFTRTAGVDAAEREGGGGGEVARTQKSLYQADTETEKRGRGDEFSAPRAVSPSSQGSVERLERVAMQQETQGEGKDGGVSGDETSGAVTRAEVGVRQFISTEIKSLYRLAKSVGMERREFGDVVARELEVLGFMDGDD